MDLSRRTILQGLISFGGWMVGWLTGLKPAEPDNRNLVTPSVDVFKALTPEPGYLEPWRKLRQRLAREKANELSHYGPIEICDELAEIEKWDPEMSEWVQMMITGEWHDAPVNEVKRYYCPGSHYLTWTEQPSRSDFKAAGYGIALMILSSDTPGWVRHCWFEYICCHSQILHDCVLSDHRLIAEQLNKLGAELSKDDALGEGIIRHLGLEQDVAVIYAQNIYHQRDTAGPSFFLGGDTRLTIRVSEPNGGYCQTFYTAYGCQRKQALLQMEAIKLRCNSPGLNKTLDTLRDTLLSDPLQQHWSSWPKVAEYASL